MARKNTPLDYRVESAIIQVCEDLTVSVDDVAKEICDEFANTDYEASFESICVELQKAREVQIQENQLVDGAESAYSDRLYVEAP